MFTSDVFSPCAVSLVWLLRLLLCCWLEPGQVETAAAELSSGGCGLCGQFPPSPAPLSPVSSFSPELFVSIGAALGSRLVSPPGARRAVVIAVTTTTTTHGTGELAIHCSLLLSPQFLPRLPPPGPQHTTDTALTLATRNIHPPDGFNFNKFCDQMNESFCISLSKSTYTASEKLIFNAPKSR